MLNLNFQNGQAPALNARNMNAIVESINTLGYAVGGPNVASTVSAMTDTSKVYVYTGSETGYTAGNWYYYNGSAWVSGGVYQATAVETDTTLTMPGEPADAKATGDAVADLKSALELGNASINKNSGPNDTTYAGIHYIKNADGSITLSGQSTATSIYNIFQQETAFPDGIYPGGIYSLSFSSINPNITLRIYFYFDSDWHTQEYFSGNAIIRVPENATGMIIRIGVIAGVTIEEETIKPIVWSALTNRDLLERIDVSRNAITPIASPTWERKGANADGSFPDENRALSEIVQNVSEIYLEPGISCHLLLYRNGGYIGKINSNGVTDKKSGDWADFTGRVNVRSYLEKEKANGVRIVLRSDTGYSITALNVIQFANNNCIVYSDRFAPISIIETASENLEYVFQNPLLPYYTKFEFAGITNADGVISIGNYSRIRCSAIIRVDEPMRLRMINPDYSFGIYWYDDSGVYHSKLWDTIWEIPAGVPVGIAIKRHEASSKSEIIEEETPWVYLLPQSANSKPKDYFQAEIEDTIQKVKDAYTEPGLCFLLSTDQHYMTVQNWLSKYDTVTDMVANMKAVSKEINVDGCIALGDIADFKIPISTEKAEQFGIKDMSYENLDRIFYAWMRYAMTQLKSVHPSLIYTPGNHDDNRYLNRDGAKASTSEWDYTKGEMFSYYLSSNYPENIFNADNNGLDYYFDYPQFKIRIVAIDSNYYNPTTKSWDYGYADSTVSWLTNILNNTPSDYSVLLLSHMSPVYTHNGDNTLYHNMDLIQNVIQGFIDNGGDFIGTFYGHSHVDWSTTSPWLDITFCSGKLHNGSVTPSFENMPGAVSPDRVIGTATEDCWNVVLIQPGSRKIKVIRFGAGNDAVYSY